MKVEIIKCLQDNYSYLLINEKNQNACVVDPSEAQPIINFVEKKNINLKFILNTHHHHDHVGGNKKLKQKYNSKVVGSKIDEFRIPEIDLKLSEGDFFKFGKINFEIIFIPGHTRGHIAFFSQSEKIIFTGDTLFSLGCGRIFEGTYEQMFASLNKIKKLPSSTKIYCGHEYTKNNYEFCIRYDGKNRFLQKKLNWINFQLNNSEPTVPISLSDELKTNIFLRCDSLPVKEALGMNNASDEVIFKKLRDLKDHF